MRKEPMKKYTVTAIMAVLAILIALFVKIEVRVTETPEDQQ
jgi:hypothetical protein